MKKILLIIAIIIILLIIVIIVTPVHILWDIDKRQSEATEAQLTAFESALAMFHDDCSRYPTEKERLLVLLSNPGIKGWNGPYLRRKIIPSDPWGQAYFYFLENSKPRLVSSGPDKTINTNDDIVHRVIN